MSTAEVALAWLLRHAPNTLPIPGTTSVAHLERNVAASRIALSEEQVQRIGATS